MHSSTMHTACLRAVLTWSRGGKCSDLVPCCVWCACENITFTRFTTRVVKMGYGKLNGWHVRNLLCMCKCFVGGGEKGDLSSCFQHCGLMKDTNKDANSNLMWYPPEPFFSHPIAKAAAEQMVNKEQLKVIPPSHHHTHNYVLHKGGSCVS